MPTKAVLGKSGASQKPVIWSLKRLRVQYTRPGTKIRGETAGSGAGCYFCVLFLSGRLMGAETTKLTGACGSTPHERRDV